MAQYQCPIWETQCEVITHTEGSATVTDSPRAGGSYQLYDEVTAELCNLSFDEKARLTTALVRERLLGWTLRISSGMCPASTIFAGWRQSVLPVHLLGLDALLGSVGPVAGDVKLEDDGVVHDPVNRRGGGHGVGKDALPLREDQV